VSVLITYVVVLPVLVWLEHLAGREAYNEVMQMQDKS